MTERLARVVLLPDGKFQYELRITSGPYATQLEAGKAARAAIVADADQRGAEAERLLAAVIELLGPIDELKCDQPVLDAFRFLRGG